MCDHSKLGLDNVYVVEKYNGWEGKEPLTMEVTFMNRVLKTWENNGYDDSDFYALVWSDENNKPLEIMYATTRFWSYPNTAIVDADEETLKKYKAFCEKLEQERKAEEEKKERLNPAVKGKIVRIVKGRPKGAKKGDTGKVFWVGNPIERTSKYGTWNYGTTQKVGIAMSEEKIKVTKYRKDGTEYQLESYKDICWTYTHNLEVVE